VAAKAEMYLKRAAEFEAKAKDAQDPSVKNAYLELARNYRHLAAHRVAEPGESQPK
jgi:hypothetical protein